MRDTAIKLGVDDMLGKGNLPHSYVNNIFNFSIIDRIMI